MAPQKLQQKDSQVNFIPRKGSDYEDDEIRVAGMGKFTKTRYKLTVKRIIILAVIFLTIILIVGLISGLIAKSQNPCLNGQQQSQFQSTDKTSDDTGATPRSVTEPNSASNNNELWHQFRLPKSLIPTFYNIEIKFDIEKEFYTGEVVIRFDCVEATGHILLHVLGLNISRESLVLSAVDNTTPVPVVKDEPFIYEPNQFYVIPLKEKLQESQAYEVRIKYSGKFSNDMSGLYLTASKPHNGQPIR